MGVWGGGGGVIAVGGQIVFAESRIIPKERSSFVVCSAAAIKGARGRSERRGGGKEEGRKEEGRKEEREGRRQRRREVGRKGERQGEGVME